MMMRKPRDFDAELKALGDKARDLKSRKVQQLGELVMAVGADTLSANELAGALIVLHDLWGVALDGRQAQKRSARACAGTVERKGKTRFRSRLRDTNAGTSNCPSNSSLMHDNGTSAARPTHGARKAEAPKRQTHAAAIDRTACGGLKRRPYSKSSRRPSRGTTMFEENLARIRIVRAMRASI
jgi:hypothetical protein